MKMQVITPIPAFKPVTVELTFETIEELGVLKTAIGIASGSRIYDKVIENEEKTLGMTQSMCGIIASQQFDFFDKLYKCLAK